MEIFTLPGIQFILKIVYNMMQYEDPKEKKMTFKIVFLDIDGTILRQDHTYSPKTKTAIEQLQNQHIKVVLATGRPLHELNELAEQLNIDTLIGYNGTFAKYKGKTIFQQPIDHSIIKKLTTIAENQQNELLLYSQNKNLFLHKDTIKRENFIEHFQLFHNDVYDNRLNESIYGATLISIQPTPISYYQIDQRIHFTPVNVEAVKGSYDVILNEVTKGTAVEKVLHFFNIQPHEAIAFGDGMNDKEMLKLVGESFAMGNAAPSLDNYAKYRTKSVEEDGVYEGLKQLHLF